MIMLYGRTGCPYTTRVIATLDAHEVAYTLKSISEACNAKELEEKGGKHQIPFLVDGEIQMYESEDIIDYIERTYGKVNSEVEKS